MQHAADRAFGRLAEHGIDGKVVLDRAQRIAAKVDGNAAVLLMTLPEPKGQAWSQDSNGNQVWAIIRGKRVVTLMFRRSTQPRTPEALRVDAVYRLKQEIAA